MDELEITESNSSITAAEIEAFEINIGSILPTSFKAFLLRNNGGRPKPNMFPIKEFYADTHGLLEWFYCIEEGNTYDLTHNRAAYHDRIQADLLPIAEDPGGNLICIAVKGVNYGKIYYWDHETEAMSGEKPTYDNVYFIAGSFDELLGLLIASE